MKYSRAPTSFDSKSRSVPDHGHRVMRFVPLIREGAHGSHRLGKDTKGHNKFNFVTFASPRPCGNIQVCQEKMTNGCVLPNLLYLFWNNEYRTYYIVRWQNFISIWTLLDLSRWQVLYLLHQRDVSDEFGRQVGNWWCNIHNNQTRDVYWIWQCIRHGSLSSPTREYNIRHTADTNEKKTDIEWPRIETFFKFLPSTNLFRSSTMAS